MKVLFYSPFANIWEHSFPEALVAETFSRHGVETVTVRCGTMLKVHCVAMSAAGVGPDAPQKVRDQVCKACIKRRDLLTTAIGLPTVIMDDRVHPEDRATVDRLVADVRPADWTALEVDGIPLGRYAAYEMWLNNKLVSTELSPAVWKEYLGQLYNTLMVFFAARRILAEEKPDAVIVYNDHYSVNHAFCAAANQAGIASYTVHGGSHTIRRAETLSMLASGYTTNDMFQSSAWHEYQAKPIGATEVDLVGSHFSGLLEASSAFAYSSAFKGTSPKELRETLGITPGVPVLLAPMSSEDELMAVRLIDGLPRGTRKKSLFPSQLEWVEYLIQYAVEHPEVHVVLRLHPRMFPNKRENVLSPVVEQIMAFRDHAPRNFTFNLPADGIGLYDLMQVVDVLLNFHSSVGAELSAFGIPVVVPSNEDFYTYPEELNRTAHSREEYSKLVGAAIEENWSIENSRKAFRWYAFLFGRVAVDFSDAVSSRPIAIRPRKPGFRLWLWRRFVYLFLQYGPLLRERLALRNRAVSTIAQEVLLDVVTNRLGSASESTKWGAIESTVDRETALLEGYLDSLAATLWADVDDAGSLAGKIRRSK